MSFYLHPFLCCNTLCSSIAVYAVWFLIKVCGCVCIHACPHMEGADSKRTSQFFVFRFVVYMFCVNFHSLYVRGQCVMYDSLKCSIVAIIVLLCNCRSGLYNYRRLS